MCSATPDTSSSSQPCSILLVEDNPINQKVVALMLGKFGIKPTLANNGQAALDAVADAQFHLILMDLHMPGMGGIETAGKIREMLGENRPAIVALTADAVQGNAETVMQQGMDGFLTKPISSETLRGCILEHTGIEV